MRDPLSPARALRFTGGDAGHETTRMLPEETAVALVYDGVTHAEMMASPANLTRPDRVLSGERTILHGAA